MLGTRDPQRDIFSGAARFSLDLEKLGFYGKLAAEGRRIFRDSDFRSCYAKVGRPSAPPSLVALARLLQHYEGISDEDVIERLRFDLRWKAALDLDPLSIGAPFVKATFQTFRYRLTLHAKEGLAFEKSVKEARERGLLPKKLLEALDSSPIRGKGAVKDTFNLLSDAVRAVVRRIAEKREKEPEEEAARLGVERHFSAASIKGSESVDWDKDDAVGEFLKGLVEDCDKVVRAARKLECAGDELELLARVIEADVDRSTETPSIKDGVAKDRLVSIVDPEMRHGHKSNGKVYSGHKAHVAVDTESGVITAIDVTAPSEPDGSKVADLTKETEKLTGLPVEKAVADCAYSSREALRQAEAVEVDLTTKMPAPAGGRFGPGEFKVSEDLQTARCPAGHAPAKTRHTKDVTVHHWSPEQCRECPFRNQCLRPKAKNTPPPLTVGRTLSLSPDFHDRRRREKKAHSPAGRRLLKRRMAVEHAIGRLKNMGAGIARYLGRAKTKAQWQWTAAVANLMTTWGHAARLEREALAGAAA